MYYIDNETLEIILSDDFINDNHKHIEDIMYCNYKSAKLDIDEEIKNLFSVKDMPKMLYMNKLCDKYGKENFAAIDKASDKYYTIEKLFA